MRQTQLCWENRYFTTKLSQDEEQEKGIDQYNKREGWRKSERKTERGGQSNKAKVKEKNSYVSKSDRLGSSDVWLKSPGTWKKKMGGIDDNKRETFIKQAEQTHRQIWHTHIYMVHNLQVLVPPGVLLQLPGCMWKDYSLETKRQVVEWSNMYSISTCLCESTSSHTCVLCV